jgi:dethiobiotin synthetase
MGKAILITGTDTGVGKTLITAGLVRWLNQKGLRTLGVKPFACGAARRKGRLIYEDIERLNAANRTSGFADCEAGCLRWKAPLAPLRASALEKKPVDFKEVASRLSQLKKRADLVLIEGVGGLCCPLTRTMTLADWAKTMRLPVLIVARLGLGTLNHTLLSLEAAAKRGLDVRGIVLNDHPRIQGDLSRLSNAGDLRQLTPVPLLGTFPFLRRTTPDICAEGWERNFKLKEILKLVR